MRWRSSATTPVDLVKIELGLPTGWTTEREKSEFFLVGYRYWGPGRHGNFFLLGQSRLKNKRRYEYRNSFFFVDDMTGPRQLPRLTDVSCRTYRGANPVVADACVATTPGRKSALIYIYIYIYRVALFDTQGIE